jgi:hypothetical protein
VDAFEVIVLTLEDGTRRPFIGRDLPEHAIVKKLERFTGTFSAGSTQVGFMLKALEDADERNREPSSGEGSALG